MGRPTGAAVLAARRSSRASRLRQLSGVGAAVWKVNSAKLSMVSCGISSPQSQQSPGKLRHEDFLGACAVISAGRSGWPLKTRAACWTCGAACSHGTGAAAGWVCCSACVPEGWHKQRSCILARCRAGVSCRGGPRKLEGVHPADCRAANMPAVRICGAMLAAVGRPARPSLATHLRESSVQGRLASVTAAGEPS